MPYVRRYVVHVDCVTNGKKPSGRITDEERKAVGSSRPSLKGRPCRGVEWQSAMPADVRLKAVTTGGQLPFVFEPAAQRPISLTARTPTPESGGS